jgi:hypothetical protein
MHNLLARNAPYFAMLGLVTFFGLVGCSDLRHTPSCVDYFKAGDMGRFKLENPYVVQDSETRLFWYRCAAGQTIVEGQCVGDPMVLDWNQAKAYAVEFSQASGRTWRVPEYDEMKALSETRCENPAYNTNAFPGLPVENFWTSTTQIGSLWQGCSVYTHTGHGHCRTRKVEPMMFMLVSDP